MQPSFSSIAHHNKGQRLTLGGGECALPCGGSGAARDEHGPGAAIKGRSTKQDWYTAGLRPDSFCFDSHAVRGVSGALPSNALPTGTGQVWKAPNTLGTACFCANAIVDLFSLARAY